MTEQFNVEGMTCAACVAAVEKAVKSIDGVEDVEVNLLTKSMNVDHDDSVSDQEIISAVSRAGYTAKSKNQQRETNTTSDTDIYKAELEDKSFRLKVSIALLIPLMYIAMGPMIGLPVPGFLEGVENSLLNIFVQLLLTTPILFVNRSYFITGFKSLFNKTPNMDSLIAIGSGASYLYGIYVIFMLIIGFRDGNTELIHKFHHEVYFESSATILTLITLGKYFEAKSKRKTSNAITKLMDLAPKTARVLRDGEEVEVNIDDIVLGDIVVVKPGERIPADGVVIDGSSSVDQSILTGESIPVSKEKGDEVYTATINNNGSINLQVTKSQENSTLSQIIKLVEDANTSKAPIAKLADKIAGIFVPVVMTIAVLTVGYWLFKGQGFEFAMTMGVSVLVISCPCALGLATPVAIMVGTGKGANFGVLIKSAESLELLDKINTVILDKTGTITFGKPFVTDIVTIDESLENLINLAYAMEEKSEHPLAEAILEYTRKERTEDLSAETFEAIPGIGIKANINGKDYYAGNKKILSKMNLYSEKLLEESDRLAKEGKTPMYFVEENKVLGIIAAADIVKPTSKEAINKLQAQGINVVMLTGDNEITAKSIAKEIGIDEVIADVLPQNKEEAVLSVQDRDEKVIMVGDGINDAPALARSDVGIAIGAGTDVAIESADVVLMKNNLLDVVNAINLGHSTMKNIKQNLFWAFFYNSLGIPVAAGVFYNSFGLTLSPMIAAAAMSFSSLFVVGNALRLNNFKPIETTSIDEVKNSDINVNKKDITIDYEKPKKENKKIFNVKGMTCNHCVNRVEKAINSIDNLEGKVDLEKEQAYVKSFDEIDEEKITKAIEDAGYEVESVENCSFVEDKKYSKVLDISGMTCNHCVKRVEKAINSLENIKGKVNLEEEKAYVESNEEIDEEKLIEAIDEAGYKVEKIG